MVEIHVPISTLRLDLKNAREHYQRAKTYPNALALQNALRAFEAFFKAERKDFVVLDGDGIPNPKHIPPNTWKIIEGGRKEDWLGPVISI